MAKGIGLNIGKKFVGGKAKFKFEDLKIWQSSIEIADELFDIADGLEKKRLYRFAEQLRGAAMSVPNNIAEGSGAISKKEFRQFLNFARRSVFENANILIITHGGVVRAINAIIKNIPFQNAFDLNVDYGQVIRLSH